GDNVCHLDLLASSERRARLLANPQNRVVPDVGPCKPLESGGCTVVVQFVPRPERLVDDGRVVERRLLGTCNLAEGEAVVGVAVVQVELGALLVQGTRQIDNRSVCEA